MLIVVTVMPIIFDTLVDVPEGTPPAAAPVSAVATVLVITVLTLRASGVLRLWVPVIGLVTGCVVSLFFGLYDAQRIVEANWVGFPVEGMGNLLSGLAGTVPNTTYSTSVAIVELTGVAARSVGMWIGALFVVAAFLPKVAAMLLAIPGPVVAAYITVLLALLFVLGMRMVVHDGVAYWKALIVGMSFWIGTGFQNQAIFSDYLGQWWGTLLGNGMTSGGLTAVFLNFAHGSDERPPSSNRNGARHRGPAENRRLPA